jgi:hypothetical protein
LRYIAVMVRIEILLFLVLSIFSIIPNVYCGEKCSLQNAATRKLKTQIISTVFDFHLSRCGKFPTQVSQESWKIDKIELNENKKHTFNAQKGRIRLTTNPFTDDNVSQDCDKLICSSDE